MSTLYVLLQFVLIGLIAWPFSMPQPRLLAILLFVAGLGVFLSAILAMNADTFTIMPEPRRTGELITHGIYRHVRHPMYLAVLLCAASACLAYDTPWKWGLALALAIVLLLKCRREENYLLARYPGYAEYRQKTHAIVPFLL